MNKIVLIIIVALYLPTFTSGQLKHYFSYIAVVYSNFFNAEKDISYFPKSILAPSFSYKIEKKRIGVELNFLTRYGMNYYPVRNKEQVPENSLLQLYGSISNLSCQYKVITNKTIQVNLMLGLSKNWFHSTVLEFWYGSSPMYEPKIRYKNESMFGIFNGASIITPLYKGIYSSTSLRYSYFPSARYNKQNFIWDIGIGYMLQRKTKR
jgi:hypothetical protein